jgi:hypothetical protein
LMWQPPHLRPARTLVRDDVACQLVGPSSATGFSLTQEKKEDGDSRTPTPHLYQHDGLIQDVLGHESEGAGVRSLGQDVWEEDLVEITGLEDSRGALRRTAATINPLWTRGGSGTLTCLSLMRTSSSPPPPCARSTSRTCLRFSHSCPVRCLALLFCSTLTCCLDISAFSLFPQKMQESTGFHLLSGLVWFGLVG